MKDLFEVLALFLKLGLIGFGGPAAHVAMMREEVVARRKWLTDEQFLDLLGATNLIPGPNSTEMTMHIGYLRAGWAGLIAGGTSFILPAMLIVTAIAWAYVRYGALPQVGWLLYGVKPVVIAIIAKALWDLGRKVIKTWPMAGIGIGVVVLYFLGVNELALLAAGGLIVMGVRNWGKWRRPAASPGLFLLGTLLPAAVVPFSLPILFLTFLKIGAVLYGSGYVLLAFLRSDFVVRLGWLTDQQLLDAVTVGQFTPGPLFTAATFIGFILGGFPGAILGTLGIFLPGFVFVAISNPLIPKVRNSPWAGALLDGVNVASAGLMTAVTLQLARSAFVDSLSILIGLMALALIMRYKINATWLVLGGALAGVAIRFLVR